MSFDEDGIACIPPAVGGSSAAERLREHILKTWGAGCEEADNSWLKTGYSPAPSPSTSRRTSSTNSGVTSSTLQIASPSKPSRIMLAQAWRLVSVLPYRMGMISHCSSPFLARRSIALLV